MNVIAPMCYQVWFSVITVHGTSLEFVLDEADERARRPTRLDLCPRGRTYTSYAEALWDMLEKEFKKSKGVRVVERSEYGELSFLLEAGDLPTLSKAYERCGKVVQRWLNKYRINKMKASSK